MTLTLILMRHAKSSWDDPSLEDFARPLNGRGRKSARALGDWLRQTGVLPDEVLVSTARRTQETWSRMAGDMPMTAEMRSEPALYHAGPNTMMLVLKNANARSILMIGHNPGICDFARRLVKNPPEHARFHDYPTGATTVMTFDAPSWQDIDWGTGAVQAFAVPRELLD